MFKDIIVYSLLNIKKVVPILTIVFQTANGVSFCLYKLKEAKCYSLTDLPLMNSDILPIHFHLG